MNKFFKFFMLFTLPLLSVMVVSCDDDEVVDDPLLPAITAVNPVEGMVGDEIIITGTGFDEVNQVRFGTVDAVGFDVTPTQITAVVPAGVDPGLQQITVASPAGSDTFNFTVIEEPTPTITSFDPVAGIVGDEVNVVGTNLNLVTSARLGETAITDFTAAADGTTATFTVPEGAVTGNIGLTTDAGTEVFSAEAFEVEPAPTITAFDPTSGVAGDVVNLTGTGLDRVSNAFIGETAITDFVATDETTATFTVPEGAATGNIRLTTDLGNEVESIDPFTVDQAGPFSFSPTTGAIGTEVTLSGADFTGTTAVRLGDLDIPTFNVAADGSSIVFNVPEGATSGRITVTTPAGDLVSTEEFTVGEASASTVIFDDEINPAWTVGSGWDVSSDLASTEQVSTGENAIKLNFSDAWGGFNMLSTEAFPLSSNARMVLSVFGAPGGGDVKLFVRPEGSDAIIEETLDVVEGEWTTFSVPVSEFGSPAAITEMGIRNMEVVDNVVHVDDIMIVE